MAEDVELQNLIMDRMEVVMGREPIGLKIIRRMLDGGEVLKVVISRNNDDAARMLARRALDALAAAR